MNLAKSPGGEYCAVFGEGRRAKKIKLGCRRLQEAERLASELRLDEVAALHKTGTITRELIKKLTGQSLTVGNAIERWYVWAQATYESKNSISGYMTQVIAWMRDTHVKNCQVSELTERDLDKWVNKKDKVKATSRWYRLAALRSLLKFLTIKCYIEADISKLVKVKYDNLSHEQKEARPKRCFTDEEYEKLVAYLRKRLIDVSQPKLNRDEPLVDKAQVCRFWLAAVIIGRHSALRLSDIATLQRASVKDGVLTCWTMKKNTRVEIPITPELQAGFDVTRLLSRVYYFPDQCILARDPSRRTQLQVQFGRILAKAGIEHNGFHMLRRAKLQEMDKAGTPIEKIAEFAGHGNPNSLSSYLTPSGR